MPNIVMLLSNSFKPDPRVLKEAQSLQQEGFNITILCWDRKAELSPEERLASGVKIMRIQDVPSSYGIGLQQLVQIPKFWHAALQYFSSFTIDMIHCHDFDTLPAGLWYGLFHRIPVVYDAHEYYADLVKPRLHGLAGSLLYQLIKLLEKLAARFATAIVTVDGTLAKIYRKLNSNVLILGHYPSINMASISNDVFSQPQLTLVYAGRLSIDRGLLSYADIIRNLNAQGIPSRLILAGLFIPEAEGALFFDYAKDIVGSIDYRGWIHYSDIPAILHSADIGLSILSPLPRYIAATPVKLFEYMACGLPVIASNFPSIAEIVNDVHCGTVVDPVGDISVTVSTIIEWWQNPSLPQALGENGRQAILSRFNWENQIKALVKMYQKLA